RIEERLAGPVADRAVRQLATADLLEALDQLLRVVHPEEDVVGALDVRVEGRGDVPRRLGEREVERAQAVHVPLPVPRLLRDLSAEGVPRHGDRLREIDSAGDEARRLEAAAVRQL